MPPGTVLTRPLDDEVRRMLAAAPPREPVSRLGVAEARAQQERLARARKPGPQVGAVADVAEAPVPIRRYDPIGVPLASILYFHGGGWVMGGIDDSDAHVRRIVESTGCTVFSVGYRLAPEHRFPAAIDDALLAWNWLRASRTVDVPCGIGGDSAGGNVAIGATIALRDAGRAGPAFVITAYPVLDARMNTPSYAEQADGPVLTADDMRFFWSQYAPACTDPRASPALAPDVSGLPPTLIMTAACDPLCDEGEVFAERLRTAGVTVRYRRFDGMIHGFYKMADILEGGREAHREAAKFIRDYVGVS